MWGRAAVIGSLILALSAPAVAVADTAPITSTGQNLPFLSATSSFDAGPSLASRIRDYRASGGYQRDISRIAAAAQSYFDDWLATCRRDAACTPAVVFDIDDTLLSSYDVYSRHDFAPSSSVSRAAVMRCEQPAIAPVVRLFNHVKQAGADIFLITGRRENKRSYTTACLERRGVTGWYSLTMRSPDQYRLTAVDYKSAERARIETDGWDIAFSIGDQFSDVMGGYVEHGFVLPNPMYAIP